MFLVVCLICSILLRFCLGVEIVDSKGNDGNKLHTVTPISQNEVETIGKDSFIEKLVSNMTIEDLGMKLYNHGWNTRMLTHGSPSSATTSSHVRRRHRRPKLSK